MPSIYQQILRKIHTYTGAVLSQRENASNRELIKTANSYLIEKNTEECVFSVIKPTTKEKIELIPIYQVMPKGTLTLESAAQRCYRIEGAKVRSNADYIITNTDRAIWSKRQLPIFTKDLPQDSGLLNYSDDTIYVRSQSLSVRKFDKVFSLCGVYSDVWSHFMLQYLVKLYNLLSLPNEVSAGLTILTPDYKDAHIKVAVHRFVKEYLPTCSIAQLQENEIAHCKELYWMDNTTDMLEHVAYVCPFDMITPAYVAEKMQQYFIPKTEKQKNSEGVKIYITRHAQWRNMTNNNEVETYFAGLGFQVIEAHTLDYDSKIRLFQSATEIVGPYSSGFSNLVFCRPGTKVLVFSNVQRTLENFLAFYVQNFHLDAMYVTEKDSVPSDPDSPFTISLERIKSAYKDLITTK